MYNKVISNFISVAPRLYFNISIQRIKCEFITSNLKFSVQTFALTTRGYSNVSPTILVHQEYAEKYKKELDELLQDPRKRALMDKYKLEIEFLKTSTYKVPTNFTSFHWLNLLKTNSKNQRRSYIEFLWKVEQKDKNQLTKKLLRRQEYENKTGNITSTLTNTLFQRIRDQTMNHFYNGRLISAMLHEPPLVFDLGYENCMTIKEQINCAKQLLLSFSLNRLHDDPFNVYFCNADRNSTIMERLHLFIPNLYEPDFPLNITSKSYLDVFDKEKLVYLSPHAHIVMKNFDPNLIYIIGAMVDQHDPKPLSYKKATMEGIRMMKFPLSEMLPWGTGSKKNLPINQVISIMLDLKKTNSWEMALKNIPRRKLAEARTRSIERLLQKRQTKLELIKGN